MPRFSIITPTYQAARFVERCYWSLANQEVGDWEWVVVDDASLDGTREVIAALGDKRIRYLRFESNAGRGRARDRALQEARGDWSTILDMDDFCFPDRLSIAEKARADGAEFACSQMLLIDDAYRVTGIRGFYMDTYPRVFPHASVSGNSDLLRRIGYPRYRRAQDQTMVLTLANRHQGSYTEEPLYVYHENANVTLKDAFSGQFYILRQLLDLWRAGVLDRTVPVLRAATKGLAKMVAMLPLFVYPRLYAKTIKRRSKLDRAAMESLSPKRREFVAECGRRFPLVRA